MTGDTDNDAKPADPPPTRYVWECLHDGCKRREVAEGQAEIRRCKCGCAMMAVAVARDDETDGPL